MTQFRKVWAITVGTLRIPAPLRVSFEIERKLSSRPGKATVKLWNLTRAHQAEIEGAESAQVVIEAGYEGDRGLETLFRGELFRARGRRQAQGIKTEAEGVEAVTHVEARDGGRAYQRARISQSFEPGVRVETVLRACAAALGVGDGNLADVAAAAELERGGTTYPEGTLLDGQASRELTQILGGMGYRWSVQHGVLQILPRNTALATQAVRLAPETGLVGRPDVGTRGRVKVTSLLNSDLVPGRIVLLESSRIGGRFRLDSVKYEGDSHAQPWYAQCELAPPEAA